MAEKTTLSAAKEHDFTRWMDKRCDDELLKKWLQETEAINYFVPYFSLFNLYYDQQCFIYFYFFKNTNLF